MKTTTSTKAKDLQVNWHEIDAAGKVLGQLSTEIVKLLTGKHKVDYVPYLNCGDKVVVLNSSKVELTGNKEQNKLYISNTQYVGNLKTYTAAQVRELNPERLIRDAVKGMLPKNRLRDVRLANLYIYDGDQNPHHGQMKDNK